MPEPLWIVTLEPVHSAAPGLILGPDVRPAMTVFTYHPKCDITVHAADAETAKAFVLEHNPGARIIAAVLK
jgi:hypothetical protein